MVSFRRNVVSLQTHNKVKRQLAQLLKKHAQFQTVLDTNTTNQSTGQPVEVKPKTNLYSLEKKIDCLFRTIVILV